ncbi:TrkA C-terminal domain-containing protein [Cesiribacter sp. SM1]|uniref:TrkA C-terminal domain-containing protein n=1 Tax=Cesiribacter sp. SM1 TaxID=2861196 RepID=UPI001CD29472|nr:TrkA C-terminal domain-containing protein [Cesiribacter sp. SM1]
MIAVITLILILSFSFLITKVATIALMHTGLSRQSAQFQARSIFTGVGYATKEAENIVNHPLRRKIVMVLMLLGNAGIVSVVATLVLTFLGNDKGDIPLYLRLALIVLGVISLWLLFSSKLFNQLLSRIINWALHRYTDLTVQDYAGILHLGGEYKIAELFVKENHWMSNCTLAELALSKEGVYILGVTRQDGSYLGVPGHDTLILTGDTVIVYGRSSIIKSLLQRRKDERAHLEHLKGVQKHQEAKTIEREVDQQKVEKQQEKEHK